MRVKYAGGERRTRIAWPHTHVDSEEHNRPRDTEAGTRLRASGEGGEGSGGKGSNKVLVCVHRCMTTDTDSGV